MAQKDLFSRLKRLFSTDVIIRNQGGNQLKVMDVNQIQTFLLLMYWEALQTILLRE